MSSAQALGELGELSVITFTGIWPELQGKKANLYRKWDISSMLSPQIK